MRRTITTLILAGAIALLCSGGSVDEQNPDTADWPSFSDEKVLEYLDNPFAGVRLYAGQEILRRWDEKKIIALCEKDWKRGCEVLYSGSWPKDGALLEAFLLGRTRPDRVGDAAVLLAGRCVPDAPGYDGLVGNQVRDLWFLDWAIRIPRSVFFTGVIDFLCRHTWARERLYRNDDWVTAWGAYYNEASGLWWQPWRLKELRHVVAILCEDTAQIDEGHVNTNHFLSVLRDCVKTGKNCADVPMVAAEPRLLTDLLTTRLTVPGAGSVSYAEMVAVVMGRPDWIPAIHKRLMAVRRVVQKPGFPDAVAFEDYRSPLLELMADVAEKRWDSAKKLFRAYQRREWDGYTQNTWSEDLWLRHPWLSGALLDKDFVAWYAENSKPFVGEADVAFLKGEWR